MPILNSLTLEPSEQAARSFRAVFSPIMETVEVAESIRNNLLTAMTEIVTNLCKHPDPKPTQIRVTLSKSANAWRLVIADDGPPFPGILANVEVPDVGVDHLRERGMGLILVQSLFPDLTYSPRSDGGTGMNQLTLQVPLSEANRSSTRVVVVDDDPVFEKLISGYLSPDFIVDSFSRPEQAIAHLETSGADLVISDIHMPGEDGFDFRRRLQKIHGLDAVPFIFLTGETAEGAEAAAAEFSIDDYLTKPISKPQLLATVRRVLKRSVDIRTRIGDRLDEEITDVLRPGIEDCPDGYTCAVAHEAATAGGGDILVDRKVPGGHLIVLADIMGHGEQAKFFAHALAGFLYGAIRGGGDQVSPASVLAELSDLFLSDKILKRSLATAVCIVLKPDGKFRYASAGHPPPLIVTEDKIVELVSDGPLLGLLDAPGYNESESVLREGDRLCLLTDGILEAGRKPVAEVADLFTSSARELFSATDREVVDELLDAARMRSRHQLHDDATAVVIRKAHDH